MTRSLLSICALLSVVAAPAVALAGPAEVRCAADPLDVTAALQRIEWARRCALTTNTGGTASVFQFNFLNEYQEINPNRSYGNSSLSLRVNSTYAACRFVTTPFFTQGIETAGPTTGFWKWAGPAQRTRPLYPAFESTPVTGTGVQLLPLPTLPNDCNLYQRNPITGTLTRWTGNFFVTAYCEST